MHTADFQKVVGSRIRQARRSMPHENGRVVPQMAFADKVGVHWVTISQWERGKQAATLANLRRISEVTGKPLEFFTGDADDEEAAQRMSLARGLEILEDLHAALAAASSAAKDAAEAVA
jgi:transcriptional regulator with XRE-family HTH domain